MHFQAELQRRNNTYIKASGLARAFAAFMDTQNTFSFVISNRRVNRIAPPWSLPSDWKDGVPKKNNTVLSIHFIDIYIYIKVRDRYTTAAVTSFRLRSYFVKWLLHHNGTSHVKSCSAADFEKCTSPQPERNEKRKNEEGTERQTERERDCTITLSYKGERKRASDWIFHLSTGGEREPFFSLREESPSSPSVPFYWPVNILFLAAKHPYDSALRQISVTEIVKVYWLEEGSKRERGCLARYRRRYSRYICVAREIEQRDYCHECNISVSSRAIRVKRINVLTLKCYLIHARSLNCNSFLPQLSLRLCQKIRTYIRIKFRIWPPLINDLIK